MYDLFITEFKRYRAFAIIALIIHTIIWAVSTRFLPFFMPHPFKMMGLTFLAVVGGCGFGLASIALHKRKNHWTYLIHRPLSTAKIYLALVGAGVSLLFIAVCLPFLMSIAFLDLFSNNVVEARHYLMALHIFLLACSAYLIGIYAILSPVKSALLAIGLIQYVAHAIKAPVAFDILVDFGLIALTFYLARGVFQVNLGLRNLGKPLIFTSVIALQPALLLLLVAAPMFYYNIPLKLLGMNPQAKYQVVTDDTDIKNYTQYTWADAKQKTQFLLSKSEHAEASSLSRQATLSEYKPLRDSFTEPSFNQQLFLKEHDKRFALLDDENDAMWVFSHNLQVYVGINSKADKIVGYFGKAGFFESLMTGLAEQQFGEIPLIVDMRFVQTSRGIYGIDFKNKRVTLKFELPEGEQYQKNVTFMFDRAIVMSNKATYFFDLIDFNHNSKAMIAEHRITHPTDWVRYDSVSITEVLHGFLIRYGSLHFDGYEIPGAALIYAKHDGNIEPIAHHQFSEKVTPDFIAYQPFILSPLVLNLVDGTLNKAIKITRAVPKEHYYFWQRQIPLNVIGYALLLMVISAAITAYVVKHLPIPAMSKRLWIVGVFFLSVPGLVALLMLVGWQTLKVIFITRNASELEIATSSSTQSNSQEHTHA